jgi:hypothetical protein
VASSEILPPLTVQIPAECERVLQEVETPAPVVAGKTDMAKAARARGAALVLANETIRQGRECVVSVRQSYNPTVVQ